MTVVQLKIELKKLGVDEDRYSLLEGFKPCAKVLDRSFGVWEIYEIIDQGENTPKQYFWDETAACQQFLKEFSRG